MNRYIIRPPFDVLEGISLRPSSNWSLFFFAPESRNAVIGGKASIQDKKAPYIFSWGGVLLVGYKRDTEPPIGLTLTQ